MQNAYPGKPYVPYQHTSVGMPDVIDYLRAATALSEVKRSTYVIFRNESANGRSGINNNYVGAQADSGLWPAKYDDWIVGVVRLKENKTGRTRLFVAFSSWHDSVNFLLDRVHERGIYVGGQTHLVLKMSVPNTDELVRAYYKDWVTGSAQAEPGEATIDAFNSMYGQAAGLFPA